MRWTMVAQGAISSTRMKSVRIAMSGGASVEDGVRVVRYLHAELDGQPREVPRVHADDGWVRVDGGHKLRAMLVQVANGILRHLSATILYDPGWPATHSKPSRTFRLPGAGGLTRPCACVLYRIDLRLLRSAFYNSRGGAPVGGRASTTFRMRTRTRRRVCVGSLTQKNPRFLLACGKMSVIVSTALRHSPVAQW